jgi:hypothetical protein
MDEIKAPEEGSMANNPEKPSGRLFSEEWTEAWKQLEERLRAPAGATSFTGHRHRIHPADSSVSKPSRASRKALPDVGATRTFSGLCFAAGKICE